MLAIGVTLLVVFVMGFLVLCSYAIVQAGNMCKIARQIITASSFAGDILNTKPSSPGRFEEENVWKNHNCQKRSSVWSADLTASIHFASLLD